jgi:hypothetical protein
MDRGEARQDFAPGILPHPIIVLERLAFQFDGVTPSVQPIASLLRSNLRGRDIPSGPRLRRAPRAFGASRSQRDCG